MTNPIHVCRVAVSQIGVNNRVLSCHVMVIEGVTQVKLKIRKLISQCWSLRFDERC